VAVYHRQVNVGEISDLTGCGTELPRPESWTIGCTTGRC